MNEGLPNNWLPLTLILPVVGGLLGYAVRRLRIEFNLLSYVPVLSIAYRLFVITRTNVIAFDYSILGIFTVPFYLDGLAGTILFLNTGLAFLIWIHTLRITMKNPLVDQFHLAMTFLLALANAIVAAGSLLGAAIAWVICLPVILGLLSSWTSPAPRTFRSYLAVMSVAYLLFFAGLLIVALAGRVPFAIAPPSSRALDQPALIFGFVFMILGIMITIGVVPVHSWLEDAVAELPAVNLAFISVLMGRLIGIYLLLRIAYYIFDLTAAPLLQIIIMALGLVTILAGVAIELFRADLKDIITFNALCQSGFIFLGIGSGHPVAVAGALFHAINCAFGQTALYLGAESVNFRMKTSKLDRLGGLAVMMPYTFVVFLAAGLALAGVPPLSGFYSKWLIYQGVIGNTATLSFWPIFLIGALIGSVMTLASFLKMIAAVFLGESAAGLEKIREVRFDMTAPTLIAAFVCVLFGFLAVPLTMRQFILPALPFRPGNTGFWAPLWAAVFIAAGLGLGWLVFYLGHRLRFTRRRPFIGGENLSTAERLTSHDFYSPLHDYRLLNVLYQWLTRRPAFPAGKPEKEEPEIRTSNEKT